MARTVRCGLIQTRNVLGPDRELPAIKKAMIDRHVTLIAEAARKKVKILCLQELFYGPYFCAEQETRWYHLTERVPDGPTIDADAEAREEAPDGHRRPGLRRGTARHLLQHGRCHRCRRPLSRQVSKDAHPALQARLLGEVLLPSRQSGYPVFETAYAKIGVYICYDRHFPEGARALGLNGAEIVFNPSATVAGLSEYLWKLEQPAHAVANGYFVGAINRVGIERRGTSASSTGRATSAIPRGRIVAEAPRDRTRSRRRPEPRYDRRSAIGLAVLPGSPARRVRRARLAVVRIA